MANVSHRTKVGEIMNGKHVAICSCGWASHEYIEARPAQLEANQHVYDNRAGKPGAVVDSRQLELEQKGAQKGAK